MIEIEIGSCDHLLDLSESYAGYDARADDNAADVFVKMMKVKLAAARDKGRGGWPECSSAELWKMLEAHVQKGDPVDVANFAMMIWHVERRRERPGSGARTDV